MYIKSKKEGFKMGLLHRNKKTKETTKTQKAKKTTKSSGKKKSIFGNLFSKVRNHSSKSKLKNKSQVGINSINLEKQVKNVSSNVMAKEAQEPEKKVPELEKQVEVTPSGVAAEGALNQEKPTPKSDLRVRKLGDGEGYAVYNKRFYPHPDKKVSYLGYLIEEGNLHKKVTELTPGATYSLKSDSGNTVLGKSSVTTCYDENGNEFTISNRNIYTADFGWKEGRWRLYKGANLLEVELVDENGHFLKDPYELDEKSIKFVYSKDITETICCEVTGYPGLEPKTIEVKPLKEEDIIGRFNNEIKEEIGKVKPYLAKLLPDEKIEKIQINRGKGALKNLLEIRRKLLKQIYEKKGKDENLVDEKIDAKLKSINSEEFSDPEKAKDAIIAQIEGIERNVLSLLKLKKVKTDEGAKKEETVQGSPKEIEDALESFLPDFKKDDMMKFKNSLKSVAKTGNRGWYYDMIGLLDYCFVMCKGRFKSPDKAVMMAILLASCCGLKSVEDVESMCKGLKKFTRENDSKDEKYMIESDKLRKKIKSKLLSLKKPSDLKSVVNKGALKNILGNSNEADRIFYKFI